MPPAELIGKLRGDGAFVGLCHPNATVLPDERHRWNSSGYNWDELDLIFGNPEKQIMPLASLPEALEIGNQGYDFSARSRFTNAEAKWDELLSRGNKVWGTASDDSHGTTPMAGWVVVFADELTQNAVLESLHSGNFYASQGPVFTTIRLDGGRLCIVSGKPAKIEFIGGLGRILYAAENATRAEYAIRGDERYVRARITHDCPEMRNVDGGIGYRRSAWTNPIIIRQKQEWK